MANTPFNIGPYQGRAIRLGSSRSLKVYRGSLELGSSGDGVAVYDTYTQATMVWFSGGEGYYYPSSVTGSWTSTGTAVGTYAEFVVFSSPVQTQFTPTVFRLGEISGQAWDTSKKIRVSFNGGTKVTATYAQIGNGGRYEFTPDLSLAKTDIQPIGTFGWSTSDIVVEVINA